ncbi:hypothetical protein NOC27_3421 [Nitrosococcus oceani AFC27]|nr:hypothetical protein [Nitrosococcus oceani]EDZ65257.1 hypothetical protein NOC27_3421 [Nitrosococcus oceani AFC27]
MARSRQAIELAQDELPLEALEDILGLYRSQYFVSGDDWMID